MNRLKLGSVPIFLIFILLVGMMLAGCSAISGHIKRGDVAGVEALLPASDYRTNSGYAGQACFRNQPEVLKLLVEKGSALEETGIVASALFSCIAYDRPEMTRYLLSKGVNIASRDLDLARKRPQIQAILQAELARRANPAAASVAQTIVVQQPQSPKSDEAPLVKSDVDELPSIKAKPNKNAYAIVIGIENYRQKLPKADFATSDAETVTKYLTKVMGYPEENVVTLLNEHATNVDFAKYFEKWLPNNIEKDSSVFIYYSGHGAPNPKTGDAYLVPYDGDPSFIDQTGYSLKRLYDSLGKLQAKEIVVALDACFSGAGGRSVLAKGARPLVMNMNNSVIPPKVAVLSAASGEQISSTYDEKGHGLFTYFLLKGLKGEAVTNGSVEIGTLFEYIKPQVERIARKSYNNEQTPQLIAPKELLGMKLR